jgi:hypothetical protein
MESSSRANAIVIGGASGTGAHAGLVGSQGGWAADVADLVQVVVVSGADSKALRSN